MSTVENLFVQIFERKNQIIDQVKRQKDAFDHHLASKLIIEGFNPPPWLLTPSFDISSLDPKELKKEEMISGLLLPCPRHIPCYNGDFSLCNKSAVTLNTGKTSDGLPMETHASNKGFDAGERLTAVPQCNNNENNIHVSGVLEPDPRATSSPDQIDAIISNIYSEPDQSLARIQRSKSRQKALESRKSSKAKGKISIVDDNNNGVYASGIALRQSNLINELLESAEPSSINNGNSADKETITDYHYSLEKGGNVSSGGVTRSRSPSQQAGHDVNMDGSSHLTIRDSVRLAPSIGKSMQQSTYASTSLDPSDIANKSQALIEDSVGDHCIKEKGVYGYSGRITRSRSSSKKAYPVEESSKLDSFSNIATVDRVTQADSIPNSLQWPNHANDILELAKPDEIKDRSCEVTKVYVRSKGMGNNVYCGRITRSRSSYQHPNCLGRFSELDSCRANMINEDGCELTQPVSTLMEPSKALGSPVGDAASQDVQGTKISLRRSSSRQKYLIEPPIKENVADEFVGRRTRSALRNTLNRSQGLKPLKSSGSSANILPCAETNNIAERCAATAATTEVISEELRDSSLFCSGSKLDGASLRVGLEVLVTRQPSNDGTFVKPKQLDFDDVEECSLNEAPLPASIKKRLNTSLGKKCSSSLVPVDSQERLISNNHHENSIPPLKKLGELEVLSKEEKARADSSEYDAEERVEVEKQRLGFSFFPLFSAGRTPNGSAVSSINKTREVYDVESLHTLSEDAGIPKLGHSIALKAFRKSSCEGPLGKAMDSDLTNVDEDIRMELSFGTGIGKELNVVPHAKMVSRESTLAVSLQGSAVKFPSVSMNESKCCSVNQKLDSGNIQLQNAEKVTSFSGNCSSNDKIVGDSKAIEPKITERSIQSGRIFSFTMGGLPQAKRKKLENQLIDLSSASPNSKREPFQSIQDQVSTNLNIIEDNSETILRSPYLNTSCEEGVEQSNNASKSPKEEMDLNMKCCTEEGIKSSHKLQVIEAEHTGEGRDKNVSPPFTFENEQLGPILVSSLTKQAPGVFQANSVEEAEGEVGTNGTLDLGYRCGTEELQSFLNLDDKVGPDIAEDFTFKAEKTVLKSNFQQEDGGLFSHCSINSPYNRYLGLFGADQTKPVLEGFVMQEDSEKLQIVGDGIDIENLDLPTSTVEHASVLEQLCLSASIHTPVPLFSTANELPTAPNIYQSVPNGLLEGMNLRSTLSFNDDAGKLHRASYSCSSEEANHTFQGRCNSDYQPFSSTQCAWDIRKPWISPVGKLWGSSTSSSGRSEKQLSLKPELACFPIDEDRSISEETEQKVDASDDASLDGISSMAITGSAIREPLVDRTEEYLKPLASVSAAEKFADRGSLDSVNTDIEIPRTQKKVEGKLQNRYERKTRGTNEMRENQSSSVAENSVKKGTESRHNKFSKPKLSGKIGLRTGGPSLLEKESKRNNIMSNITSFVPLVQRTQGAAVITGKRDVKVKALEAAEAAKRLEEKKENERKMKKEAFKLERARQQQENLRQLELPKKKKEEEKKKKEAEMAGRKRPREEEEKEKGAKRKRTEEARRQQREHEQKLRAEKEKEKRCRATVEKVQEGKEAIDEVKMDKKVEVNLVQKPETELRTASVSTSDNAKASIIPRDPVTLSNCGEIQKVTDKLDKASENNLVANTSVKESYEMSPYQSSDDEEEEEDDIGAKKFIPSWASKNYLFMAVSSQQKADPRRIFPPESFCSINEVLVSRKQQ